MGLIDTPEDDEEQDDNSNDSASGTYIHFISGPGHRDWKDSWSDEAAAAISEAWAKTAPESEDSVIPEHANDLWEDRQHFFADVTLAIASGIEDHDFQDLLELFMGDPQSEEAAQLYADELARFLSDEEEIGSRLAQHINTTPDSADESEPEPAEADD